MGDDLSMTTKSEPPFSMCISPAGGWVRLKLVRCTNLSPLGASEPVTQAQCSCWIDRPSKRRSALRRSTKTVTGDALGGAAWDEEVWLALPAGPVAVQLELQFTHATDDLSYSAETSLHRGTGSIALDPQLHQRRWFHLEGMGSLQPGGEQWGSAELLVEVEVLCTAAKGGVTLQTEVLKGGAVQSTRPTHDVHGFPLRVQPVCQWIPPTRKTTRSEVLLVCTPVSHRFLVEYQRGAAPCVSGWSGILSLLTTAACEPMLSGGCGTHLMATYLRPRALVLWTLRRLN